MKQASLALAYPQAWVEQKGVRLQWQQQAPSHAQQLSGQGGGPGGYVAPQAAHHPLSTSTLNNPHQKASFARLGRGGPEEGGPGRAVAKLPYLASSLKKLLFYSWQVARACWN